MAQDFDIDDFMAEPPQKPKATKPVEIDITKPALSDAGFPAIRAGVEVQTERATFEATALINQRIGRKAVIDAFSKLLTVSDLIDLQRIKESKSYKGAQVVVEGKLLTVTTWDDFCGYVENRSRQTVDLEMANLEGLGQPTFEALRKIGIGPATMRSIRQLPDDDKAVIEQVASTSNKDELIELIDGLVAKHQKQNTELNEKVAALQADLTQAGKRANNMDAEIERLTLTNERLVNKQRLTSFEPFTEDVRLECMHLQAGVELHLNSLKQLFYRAYENEQTAEQSLRVEQVYISIVTAVARGLDLLESIHEHYGNPDQIPQRIQAQHVLTPPEAERWLLEFESLKNAHNAAEAARQIARDKDKPRGRGRPAGSTNKGE